MKALRILTILVSSAGLSFSSRSTFAEFQVTNRPPEVSIAWPRSTDDFSAGEVIKIKANAVDPDGAIAQVRYFADTKLIGIATNPPFNIVWTVERKNEAYGTWDLKVVAFDNLGSSTESTPVRVGYGSGGRPPFPVLEIVSPSHGDMFAAPATYAFTAELLVSASGGTGPVDFYVGTNLIQRVDQNEPFTGATPPYSITVSNLLEGTYELRAKYMGGDSVYCICRPITGCVVKLGAQLPRLTPDGRLQFEVVTAFPGKETIIQASPNLRDWTSISTNVPSTNSFQFIDPNPLTPSERFYRVVVPP